MLRTIIRASGNKSLANLLPSQQSTQGNRVVLLGGGWAGFNLALNLSKDVPLTIVSCRNHFLFTPLLPSVSVGTLEFRCIQEPIRTILGPKGDFVNAKGISLDADRKVLFCESANNEKFELEYDKLIIACGAKTNTFGIASVSQAAKNPEEPVYFLKQLAHAREIRNNIVDSFEKAALPTVTPKEKERLLTFVVVGGGPTSCEFTSELHDFVKQDVKRLFPKLLPYIKIVLIEAGPALLGPFDRGLQEYAYGLFQKRDIDVRLTTAVTDVEDFDGQNYRFKGKRALLSDGTSLEFGTMIWSAGLAPRAFTENLPEQISLHERNKRILVDDFLRVKGNEGSIWAIGDAAINDAGTPLPQLAQVARQQGMYLAKTFSGEQGESEKPFEFFSLGSMAFMGNMKGIYDGSSVGPVDSDLPKPPKLTGLAALFLWRFAYWGRQVSVRNKILIPVHWFKTFFFGRDTSRF